MGMAVRFFALNGVPDEEAAEVRKLLSDNGIDYYETPAGNWGISVPAIWLKRADQVETARELLTGYQEQRRVRVRQEYAQLKAQGENRTVLHVIRENPVRFVVYLAAAALVVYFSIKPFIDIGR
jgi:hypothetical protein